MLETVKLAINKYKLLQNVRVVTVALSGGADSVSLLYAMLKLRDEFCIEIEAAHLNHMIRGEEANRDESFVKQLCKDLGVKLYCERIDVPKIAQEKGQSLELVARQVRYDFLSRVAEDVIATAHTANDNIETVLFNMSRGTGIDGLCGIPAKRDNIIRPLILATREQVEKFCEHNNIDYCTDSTNNEDVYTRNRIRHNVVPELNSINSGAVDNVSRMCDLLNSDAEFLDSYANSKFKELFNGKGLDVEQLKELHPAIRTRCIAKLAKVQTNMSLEYVHISSVEKMLDCNLQRVSIKGDFEANCRKGVLRFEKLVKTNKKESVIITEFPFSNGEITLQKVTFEDFENIVKVNSSLLKSAFDCDKILGKLVLRTRQEGDSIKLQSRNVTKTLKKLFNESDLPKAERETLNVLSDDNGVLWVENFGVDSKVLIDENTKSVIMIVER